jgi:hypothetical protein
VQWSAKRLFDRIKPQLEDDWIAVYTAPDVQGNWKVYVAQGGDEIEFPVPNLGK